MKLVGYTYIKDFYRHKLYIEDLTNELFLLKEYKKDQKKEQKEVLIKLKEVQNNANVPKIIEVIEKENNIYCIEEYIQGASLKDYVELYKVKEESLPISFLNKFLKETINTLEQFKSVNLIHRDLKPDNIIVSDDNKIYVIDFDISRIYKKDSQKDTKYFGTEGYAAPEQYGYAQTNFKTDIYSLGMIIKFLYNYTDNNKQMEELTQKLTSFSPDDRLDYKQIKEYINDNDQKSHKNRNKLNFKSLFNIKFFNEFNKIVSWSLTLFFFWYFLIYMCYSLLKDYEMLNPINLILSVIFTLIFINLFNNSFKSSNILVSIYKLPKIIKWALIYFIRFWIFIFSLSIVYLIAVIL